MAIHLLELMYSHECNHSSCEGRVKGEANLIFRERVYTYRLLWLPHSVSVSLCIIIPEANITFMVGNLHSKESSLTTYK